MAANDHLRGKSIIDLLWEDLDSTMDILMDTCEECGAIGGAHPYQLDRKYCNVPQLAEHELKYDVREYKGRAQGVAYALSLMSNPYLANVAAVRKKAKERYEDRLAGREMQPLQTQP